MTGKRTKAENRKCVSALAVMAAALIAVFASAAIAFAQGALTPRELNSQNMALNRCEQFLKSGRIEDAIKSYNEALSFKNACEFNPNFKRVTDIYDKQRKEYVKKLTDEGNNLFMSKKYEDAKRLFKKIKAVDPANMQAEDKIKLCEEQLKLLERVRETHHDNKIVISDLEKIDSAELRKQSLRALELMKQKRLAEALDIFLYCRRKDSANPYFKDKIRIIENLMAVSKLSANFNAAVAKNHNDPTCEVILNSLEKEDPEFKARVASLDDRALARHLLAIGNYYFKKKDYSKAESVMNRCVDFVGDRNEIKYLLGLVFYEKQRFWDSYQKFKFLRAQSDLADDIRPDVRKFYYELMLRIYKYLFATMLIQALVSVFVAWRSYPIVDYAFDGIITRFFTFRMYDAKHYYEKALIAINRGNYSGAVSNLRKCLSLDKENLNAAYNLGLSLFKVKDYAASRTILEALMKVMPNHQRAAYYLAILYDSTRLQKEAIRMLEVARGITVTQRSFSFIEIEKNRGLYMAVFQDYKNSADKILNLSEDIITPEEDKK